MIDRILWCPAQALRDWFRSNVDALNPDDLAARAALQARPDNSETW